MDWKARMNEYYKSPHWQKIREEKLEEANYQCEKCGSNIDLQVHHNHYRHLWNENLGDLQALCEECHIKGIHKKHIYIDMRKQVF